MKPKLSNHFLSNEPSAIRTAQQLYLDRTDKVDAINAAIGNVSLPMHPAMQRRMFELDQVNSPFRHGIVKYTSTKGTDEANAAVKNVLKASGINTKSLFTQITEGGSAAMELVILGIADQGDKILMIDPAYTNYASMAKRTGRKIVTVSRSLKENGEFELPDFEAVEEVIEKVKPKAIIIIPFDNPTGQFMSKQTLINFAKLAVKHNMWLVSDEAYRELYYKDEDDLSIWSLDNYQVKNIEGRRISIESASKVWNACGLRIGALVSDNQRFIEKSIAENTANLCPNAIGQYIYASLANETTNSLKTWFGAQKKYYKAVVKNLGTSLQKRMPQLIISNPDSALYCVLDFKLVEKHFNAIDFAKFSASVGKVKLKEKPYTLLFSPMSGFYSMSPKDDNPGTSQIRLSYVETPERIKLIPELLEGLLFQFQNKF